MNEINALNKYLPNCMTGSGFLDGFPPKPVPRPQSFPLKLDCILTHPCCCGRCCSCAALRDNQLSLVTAARQRLHIITNCDLLERVAGLTLTSYRMTVATVLLLVCIISPSLVLSTDGDSLLVLVSGYNEAFNIFNVTGGGQSYHGGQAIISAARWRPHRQPRVPAPGAGLALLARPRPPRGGWRGHALRRARGHGRGVAAAAGRGPRHRHHAGDRAAAGGGARARAGRQGEGERVRAGGCKRLM